MEPIQRDIRAALEELTCSICLGAVTDPVALRCGHIGCSGCLEEWLARKNECPLCKCVLSAPSDAAAPIKVHALDGVLSKLVALDEAVDKLRLDAALTGTGAAGTATAGAAHAGGVEDDVIAALFRNHVRSALDTCTEYVRQLRAERDAAVAEADKEAAAVIAASTAASAGGDAAAQADAAARAAQARALCDAAKLRAQKRFDAAYAGLQADVETYLQSAAAPVTLLPASITINVPALGVRFDTRLRPMDTIAATVMAQLRKTVLDTLHCDVLEFGAEVGWSWEAPMDSTPAASRKLDAEAVLFHQFPKSRPPAGTVITCTGAVKASSARASKCLADVWTAGQKEDFFWCTTCSLKWICSTCAEKCHKASGHNVVPFLKQHAPTFACCYCKTRGKCQVAASPRPAAGAEAGAAAIRTA